MKHSAGKTLWFVGVACFALLAAACGGGGEGAGGSDSLTLSISSPEDGAQVSSPFTVEVEASEPLGEPDTGEHHVHLCFDGAECDDEYELVYGDTFEVSDLSAGEHTIEASLRNADHSDAAVSDEVTVTVEGGGGGKTDDETDTGGNGGGGYDY
jgi:hypothetical protein